MAKGCKHEYDDGRACKSPFVDQETGYCGNHGPGASERMAERGRKGAEATARKWKGRALSPDDLPPLDSPQTAALWLDRVGRAVATGRLGHREATAVVRAVEAFLRAHDAGAVTGDIERLRSALEEWTKTGDNRALMEVVR